MGAARRGAAVGGRSGPADDGVTAGPRRQGGKHRPALPPRTNLLAVLRPGRRSSAAAPAAAAHGTGWREAQARPSLYGPKSSSRGREA